MDYECNYCGTRRPDVRWASGRKCGRCSNLLRRIRDADTAGYNPDDQDSGFGARAFNEVHINALRQAYIDALNQRIEVWRDVETKLRDGADRWDIEYYLRFQFCRLFNYRRYHDIAERFYHWSDQFLNLEDETVNAIYKTIVEIYEALSVKEKVEIPRETRIQLGHEYFNH